VSDGTVRIALVCVQNAGRSRMTAAFAERERRGPDGAVEILTGGTRPADSVHEVVVAVMREVGVDVSDRTPREITAGELASCTYVATMGCSTLDLDPDAGVDVRDWALDDPDGKDLDAVREIRDQVRRTVSDPFDEISDRRSA